MTIAASGGGGFFLIIIAAFILLWLIVVRPQRRRQSDQKRMLRDLRIGDEVLTAGGIYGTIVRLDENEAAVEIAPQLEVRVARRAIAAVLREPDAEDPDDEPDSSAEADEHGVAESGGEASGEQKHG